MDVRRIDSWPSLSEVPRVDTLIHITENFWKRVISAFLNLIDSNPLRPLAVETSMRIQNRKSILIRNSNLRETSKFYQSIMTRIGLGISSVTEIWWTGRNSTNIFFIHRSSWTCAAYQPCYPKSVFQWREKRQKHTQRPTFKLVLLLFTLSRFQISSSCHESVFKLNPYSIFLLIRRQRIFSSSSNSPTFTVLFHSVQLFSDCGCDMGRVEAIRACIRLMKLVLVNNQIQHHVNRQVMQDHLNQHHRRHEGGFTGTDFSQQTETPTVITTTTTSTTDNGFSTKSVSSSPSTTTTTVTTTVKHPSGWAQQQPTSEQQRLAAAIIRQRRWWQQQQGDDHLPLKKRPWKQQQQPTRHQSSSLPESGQDTQPSQQRGTRRSRQRQRRRRGRGGARPPMHPAQQAQAGTGTESRNQPQPQLQQSQSSSKSGASVLQRDRSDVPSSSSQQEQRSEGSCSTTDGRSNNTNGSRRCYSQAGDNGESNGSRTLNNNSDTSQQPVDRYIPPSRRPRYSAGFRVVRTRIIGDSQRSTSTQNNNNNSSVPVEMEGNVSNDEWCEVRTRIIEDGPDNATQ